MPTTPKRLTPDEVKEIVARLNAAAPDEWGVEYHPYPSEFDGDGEPNPPVAFVGPKESDEAIALVFPTPEEDPILRFDSPSLKANADFFVQAHNHDLPALCAEYFTLLAEVETLRQQLREIQS